MSKFAEAASFSPPLSTASSFGDGLRSGTPSLINDHGRRPDLNNAPGLALIRSASISSLRSLTPAPIKYPEESAKNHLRDTRVAVDFSCTRSINQRVVPVSCTSDNVLLFTRGNRVHLKNFSAADDIGQLCKLQESYGDLTLLESGSVESPETLALASNKGFIQIWDVKAKKMTSSWSTKGVAAMAWNGPVLTVGGIKGSIRHYDTRITPNRKMKEQARKITRHQTSITQLAWNIEGKLFASADETGTVHVWDPRQKVPLDVGELVQRRKKMQHGSLVSVDPPPLTLMFSFIDPSV